MPSERTTFGENCILVSGNPDVCVKCGEAFESNETRDYCRAPRDWVVRDGQGFGPLHGRCLWYPPKAQAFLDSLRAPPAESAPERLRSEANALDALPASTEDIANVRDAEHCICTNEDLREDCPDHGDHRATLAPGRAVNDTDSIWCVECGGQYQHSADCPVDRQTAAAIARSEINRGERASYD